MKRRVVVCGKAGSGKDYLRDTLRQTTSLKCDLSVTTRPPRATEKDGVAYHFYSNEAFDAIKSQSGFYEHDTFNGWQYGTLLTSWEKSHFFIMTPGGINAIVPNDRVETHVLFLDIPEDVRRQRLAKRVGDADNTERRLTSDAKAFANFVNYDQRITDPLFDPEEVARGIEELLRV